MIKGDIIKHYGRLGMKWGQHKFRRQRSSQIRSTVKKAKTHASTLKAEYRAIKNKTKLNPTEQNITATKNAKSRYKDAKSRYKVVKAKAKEALANIDSEYDSARRKAEGKIKVSEYTKNRRGITEQGRELKNIRAYNNREQMSTKAIEQFTKRLNAENAMQDAVYKNQRAREKQKRDAEVRAAEQRAKRNKMLYNASKGAAAMVAAYGIENLSGGKPVAEQYGIKLSKNPDTGKTVVKGKQQNIDAYRNAITRYNSVAQNSNKINNLLRSYASTNLLGGTGK